MLGGLFFIEVIQLTKHSLAMTGPVPAPPFCPWFGETRYFQTQRSSALARDYSPGLGPAQLGNMEEDGRQNARTGMTNVRSGGGAEVGARRSEEGKQREGASARSRESAGRQMEQ